MKSEIYMFPYTGYGTGISLHKDKPLAKSKQFKRLKPLSRKKRLKTKRRLMKNL